MPTTEHPTTRQKRLQARTEMLDELGYEHPYSDDQLADMLPAEWGDVLTDAMEKKRQRDQA